MCRWIEIWLGQADIPAVYKELIEETGNYLNQDHEYYWKNGRQINQDRHF